MPACTRRSASDSHTIKGAIEAGEDAKLLPVEQVLMNFAAAGVSQAKRWHHAAKTGTATASGRKLPTPAKM